MSFMSCKLTLLLFTHLLLLLSGPPMKKQHHDHVTAAGEGLATKDNHKHSHQYNSMCVSQTEAEEGRLGWGSMRLILILFPV